MPITFSVSFNCVNLAKMSKGFCSGKVLLSERFFDNKMSCPLLFAPTKFNAVCVSSEAAFVMRVGLSVGEVEQPSPSNRLYAALL
jgi:hypothetical protein